MRPINPSCLSFRLLIGVVVLATGVALSPGPLNAASDKIKDVCASGCTYTSVQAAINDITDSGPDKVYTILIDAGVLESDASITTNPSGSSPKSHINFVGRGIGASTLRASTTWFQTSTIGDFFDLSGSTNITIRGLTIDARTQDPGNVDPNKFAGVRVDNADRILVDSARLEGLVYALWESTNASTNLIQVINSQIRGVSFGMQIRGGTWHVLSSDVRAINDGNHSAVLFAHGVEVLNAPNVTFWGSHLHGETSLAGQSFAVSGLRVAAKAGARLTAIGSTIHVKVGTTDIGTPTRPMYALYIVTTISGGTRTIDLVGTDLIYEGPVDMSQGRLAGLGYVSGRQTLINLVGASFIDGGGSGGARGDIVDGRSTSAAEIPVIRNSGSRITTVTNASGFSLDGSDLGAWFDTINTRKGTATFPGTSSVTVSLSPPLPDASYRVTVTSDANETTYVTDKTSTGFTIRSSNSSSSASVDWVLIR